MLRCGFQSTDAGGDHAPKPALRKITVYGLDPLTIQHHPEAAQLRGCGQNTNRRRGQPVESACCSAFRRLEKPGIIEGYTWF